LIELVRTETGQSSTVKTVAVSLLQAKDSSAENMAASAKAAPDPVLKGEPVQIRFSPNAQDWAQAKLYNQDGELVCQASAAVGSGILTLKSGLSGGIYLVDFEVRRNEAILARRILKLAVVR
jgi:hypothetical protein